MRGRILLAAPGSGSGKTMISMAVMSAMKKLGVDVAGYKCGPDYIDPMFHMKALGIPSRNLDPYFCDAGKLRSIVSMSDGIAVIEGVMGYYDGIGVEGKCSTYEVARATDTPVILIINPKGMYTSVVPLIKGFREYKEDSHIKGVIFNNTSERMYEGLKDIAIMADVKPLGFIPNDSSIAVESRHLGLVTADEIKDIDDRINRLTDMAIACLDMDGIIELACSASDYSQVSGQESYEEVYFDDSTKEDSLEEKPVIAVAFDDAFCFLYEDNLEAIRKSGGELLFFSPLSDQALPSEISGLYIPGGYPELYLEKLSNNVSMRSSIKSAIDSGLPTIAECGGFMYLGSEIDGIPMVGAINTRAEKTSRLKRFGYGEMECDRDTLIAGKGEKIRIHEFHYYDSDNTGSDYVITKASNGIKYPVSFGTDRLYAGYPHLYFNGDVDIAGRFIEKAKEYMNG